MSELTALELNPKQLYERLSLGKTAKRPDWNTEQTVVASAETSGPIELKDFLLEEKAAFTRTLVKNQLIYALGRGLQGNDECVIRNAMKAAEQNGDRFSAIVIEIVKSFPFRYRQNPID